MRNPDRIDEVLTELKRLWELVPDWRLGQLVVNCADTPDPFYIEDDLMLQRIKKMKESKEDQLLIDTKNLAKKLRELED